VTTTNSVSAFIKQYHSYWIDGDGCRAEVQGERQRIDSFESLLKAGDQGFHRNHYQPGHFTGSALVVSPDFERVLLTLHAKLGKWLQLGGHADGDRDLLGVASREVEEESGLRQFQAWGAHLGGDLPLLLDVDCHSIPSRKDEPQHQHFDARFLFIANPDHTLQISDESKDLQWFSRTKARDLNPEPSMQRLYDKLDFFAATQKSQA
jgi:8-oxo-dGTP pyrophosphatase MutT (NUDIX family)